MVLLLGTQRPFPSDCCQTRPVGIGAFEWRFEWQDPTNHVHAYYQLEVNGASQRMMCSEYGCLCESPDSCFGKPLP